MYCSQILRRVQKADLQQLLLHSERGAKKPVPQIVVRWHGMIQHLYQACHYEQKQVFLLDEPALAEAFQFEKQEPDVD